METVFWMSNGVRYADLNYDERYQVTNAPRKRYREFRR